MIVASVLLILVAVGSLVLGLASGSSPLLVASIAASLLAAIALVVGARQAATARAAAAARTGATPGGTFAAPAVDIPGQYIPTTVDTDDAGWRQPPGPSATVDPFAEAGPFPGRPAPGHDSAGDPFAATTGDPYAATTGDPYAAAAGPDDAPGSDVDADRYAGANPYAGRPPFDPLDERFVTPEPVVTSVFLPDEPPAEPVTPAQAALVARLDAEVRVVDGRPRYHLADCVHLVGRDDESLPVAEAVELGFTPCSRCTPHAVLLAGSGPS
ncbi:hypothetical protein GA0070564_108126 [Micromonospora mirobrigensis]|uniref:Clumping factor A n=1 Tax=Micromonospora mirobrigensis TaxID=262898 RepID=A0A1C5A9E7_9ACTN|nr:hypothetical protein GA0070564_108126 [Micromonospora mirobrigensis]